MNCQEENVHYIKWHETNHILIDGNCVSGENEEREGKKFKKVCVREKKKKLVFLTNLIKLLAESEIR